MTLFYISFATEAGFLGGTVVAGADPQAALVEATRRGLNPGGEAAILELPATAEAREFAERMRNRLVSRAEMVEAHGGKRVGDLPEHLQDAFDDATTYVCEDCNET